jgi:hypothetical protein
MNSTPTPKETDAHDAPVAGADERLTHAREQIKRADEVLARLTEQVAKMERDDAHPPSVGPAPQSTSAGPSPQSPSAGLGPQSLSAPPAPQPPPRRLSLRTLAALPLAACVVVAALVLQSSYGGGAKRWAPQLASTPSAPPENLPSAAQPAPPTVQVAAAEAPVPQSPSLAQTAPPQASAPPQTPSLAQAAPPQDASPTATAALPDQTQLLQTIARDLANLERTIEQLKSNQQQMVNDNSKAIGELKASQDEMKRALAKVSEQNPPKASPPATRPAPTFRRPERPPPQARARPRYPREWIYDDYW